MREYLFFIVLLPDGEEQKEVNYLGAKVRLPKPGSQQKLSSLVFDTIFAACTWSDGYSSLLHEEILPGLLHPGAWILDCLLQYFVTVIHSDPLTLVCCAVTPVQSESYDLLFCTQPSTENFCQSLKTCLSSLPFPKGAALRLINQSITREACHLDYQCRLIVISWANSIMFSFSSGLTVYPTW